MHSFEVILDCSSKELTQIPERILVLSNLKMLYLNENSLEILPQDFFEKLPNLNWLDLRENVLTTLPPSIAHHRHLENLLLQNNLIEKLPTELGTVPNLKVLQLSGNPLIYPPQNVIDRGADDICIFLKSEYFKDHEMAPNPHFLNHISSTSGLTTTKLSSSSNDISTGIGSASTNTTTKDSTETLVKSEDVPSITIKSLNKRLSQAEKRNSIIKVCSKDKSVHRVYKTTSKLSVVSRYNGSHLTQNKKVVDNQVKQVWLEKLKDLIHDQEKIIQQEKTLGALSSWRKNKKEEPKRMVMDSLAKIPEAPYDTEPEYNKLMSRRDFTLEIEKLLATKKANASSKNIDQLLCEVISKLKEMEVNKSENMTPAEKIKSTENEIKTIVELHKKISKLQATNNVKIK